MLVTTRTVAANCLPCFIFRILRRPLEGQLNRAGEVDDANEIFVGIRRAGFDGIRARMDAAAKD